MASALSMYTTNSLNPSEKCLAGNIAWERYQELIMSARRLTRVHTDTYIVT